MKELFDVHCHMVPGVDDGAADLEESLAMLKMQHEDGVRKIIITPHYRRRMFETPAKKVHEQFLKLQEAAKKEYPDMSLYLGCELHSNMDLQDILEKRKYVTMAGTLVRGMSYYTGPIFEIAMDEYGGSVGGGGRYDEMIGKFTGNQTCACGFSIGFERIVMLLLERDYQIPGAQKKKAYLIEKNMPAEGMQKIIQQATKERSEGTAINIAVMKKNKKFQKEQLASEGYTEIEEFFVDKM